MQTNAVLAEEAEPTSADLGPLAWVLDELKKSLEGATRAMRRFVRDAELARGSDLAELDASQLRIARQQLHQAVGALEMVGLIAPAKVMRAMEALAQKFVQRPELCSDDAANKLERASFALTEYLEGVLKGKTASPVALFPQYRDVLDLVGGDRVHPADLWPIDWTWNDAVMPHDDAPLPYSPAVRAQLDQSVLRLVKAGDTSAAHALSGLSAGLAEAQIGLEPRVFWKICAAFFEATAKGLCATDVYAKRAASRVLMQYATLARGDPAVSDRLAQDLLFFCAQAMPTDTASAPILAAVRQAYHLTGSKSFDYVTPQFGRFDPAVLVQARKRIATATEAWSALAGGDTNRLKIVADQFGAVSDSILKLHPESGDLARALLRAVDNTVRSGEPPSTPVAMEVATTVLYLEAAYDDLDPTDSQMTSRGVRLAQRLEHVGAGGQSEPLEGWMEELYHRVSDRQTMGSVVDELRTTLGEVEKALDQFFRNPGHKAPLHEIPGRLAQMRGVFSVLGLDQASLAMLRMRDSVEKLLVDDVGQGAVALGGFEKMGSSISALGFLIDMLNYQRVLAKKLFIYDEAAGEFRPVMGREKTEPSALVPPSDTTAADASGVELPALAMPTVDVSDLDAPTIAQARVAPAAAFANVAEVTLAPAPIAEVAPAPAPAPLLDDDEAEIRDIFLEEAREVLQNALVAVKALAADPTNLADQTTLRRAFHTLKGSSRMVGLTEFGEAAWAMEQLLNARLAEQLPASAELISLSKRTLNAFEDWVEDIAALTDSAWSAPPFRKAADALRLENKLTDLAVATQTLPRYEAPVVAPVLPGHETTQAFQAVPASAPEPLPVPVVEPVSVPEPAIAAIAPAPTPEPADFLSTQIFEIPNFAEFEPSVKLPESGPVSTPGALPAATATAAAASEDLLDFDLDFAEPEAPAEPEFAPTGFVSSLDALAEALPGPEVEPTLPEPPQPPEPIELIEPVKLPALAELPVSDQVEATDTIGLAQEDPVKIIGTLRIGIPLYNVYLNEADEWSRRLLTELSEWSLELHQPLEDSTIALAHSLSGSSATVGFMALSDIARALEQALQHVQLHRQNRPEHAQVFTDAAEDIRRLLHQFAAGFLKVPSPDILQSLKDILETDFSVVEDIELPALEMDTLIADEADTLDVTTAPAPAALEPEPAETEPGFADSVSPAVTPSGFAHSDFAQSAQPTQTLPAATLQLETAPALVDDHDDDIDQIDALDADLFPIFEEEALELMPQLGGALRQWSARPENLGARGEVLRVLHTLKGSARLSGALRLGEMTHRLESVIEQLGAEPLVAAQFDPLLTRFDAIQANFEALRAGPEQAMVLPEATKEAIEPASVAVALESVPEAATPLVPPKQAKLPMTGPAPVVPGLVSLRQIANQSVRVRSNLLDRMVNQAGEVMITRSRLESRLGQLRGSLNDLSGNLDRLRHQLRDIEVQSESQMQSRLALAKDHAQDFDPLEFDRFTRVQELTRMMAESVNDVATVQRNLQRTVEGTEDDLIAQGRQARELQRDLLRTRMVEFEAISERLYGVVRQASKEAGKQVKLDITGGSLDVDRGVLERMAPAFEHLLRNSVAHGIEAPAERTAAGKPATGTITINLQQQSNEISVEFHDDGAGLDLPRLRAKAVSSGAAPDAASMTDEEASNLVFLPGLSTAPGVTELSGRGIGMDVVRSEVNALGGRIETSTTRGKGTAFKLVLPLTTAVTQVVMMRIGELVIGVPANVIEVVRRVPAGELDAAYKTNSFTQNGEAIGFFWAGALLQASSHSSEAPAKNLPVAVFRSAGQRVAVHVDEVLGNQEVVVKNLGPQLARLPGLTGMSVLASGAVVLIYNPVALAAVYGERARALRLTARVKPADGAALAGALTGEPGGGGIGGSDFMPSMMSGVTQVPLVMVVDDSITVRRVTQRLLKREGYRVVLAADGLQALERLQDEKPSVVLSDIEMPRMDGFDLARNIRADASLRDLPIIMITSRIAEKHREHARDLGVDHYLGKPYSEDELLGLVRQYCTAKAQN